MKKIILSLCMIFSCMYFVTPIHAEEYDYEETIEVIQTARSTSTKTGKKTVNCKDSSGNVMWSLTVIGTFSYNGKTSKCTSVSASKSVKDSSWKLLGLSSSKSGNKATAKVTAKYYIDGSVIGTTTKSAILTCSASGKLS